jgi:hypothetical protein
VRLGVWASHARAFYRAGNIRPWLATALDAIPGWSWFPYRDTHRQKLDVLRRFVRAHGWDGVERGVIVDGVDLYAWVRTCRGRQRRGDLPRWVADALAKVPGWNARPRDARFHSRVALLRAFVAERGWPVSQKAMYRGVKLGVWVASRRSAHRNRKIPAWQIPLLERVPGWRWEPKRDGEAAHWAALRAYVHKHRTAMLPVRASPPVTVNGVNLSSWVEHLRAARRRGRLALLYSKALEKLPGWSWDPQGEHSQRQAALYAKYRRLARRAGLSQADLVDLCLWLRKRRAERSAGLLNPSVAAVLRSVPGWR